MPTGVILSTDKIKLLRTGLSSLFGDIYKGYDPVWSKTYTKKKGTQYQEQDQKLVGFNIAQVKNEGDATVYVKDAQRYTVNSQNQPYGLGFIVTKEEVMFNLYEKNSARKTRYLSNAMLKRQEVDGAQVYNDAFSTSGVTGAYADGQALISSSHVVESAGGGTQSNIIATNADLTETTLESLYTQIRSATDDNGIPINLLPKILKVNPLFEPQASRILNSQNQPGNANNDINFYNGRGIQLVVDPYQTDTDAFFLFTDIPEAFVMYEFAPIEFDQDNDFDTKNLKFSSYMNYKFQKVDWRGIYGSQGA